MAQATQDIMWKLCSCVKILAFDSPREEAEGAMRVLPRHEFLRERQMRQGVGQGEGNTSMEIRDEHVSSIM